MQTSLVRRWAYLAMLILPLGFVACDEDDTPDVIQDDDTITNNIGDASQFSTLDDLLDDADLKGTLRDDDQTFTVFAPNNAAFAAADLSSLSDDDVRDLLLYHVLVGTQINAADIADGVTTIDNGYDAGPSGETTPLYVVNDADGIRVNMATVISADNVASNGVIHEVDAVIMPPNVVEIAQILPGFSSLVDAVVDADLVDDLSGDGPFTVFAPTDQAFMMTGSLPTGTRLVEILQGHVVRGNVLSGDLMDGMVVNTLAGSPLTIGVNGSTVTVTDERGNTRTVVATDNQGTNGVVHAVDGVLLNN